MSATRLQLPFHFERVMERYFEKRVCLGSGIAFLILLFMISLPNGFVLFVLLKNPLRFPRRSFTVFLAFICATDLFVGLVVSSGEALTRFLCAFGDRGLPQEGDVMRVLSYIGVNSSMLLVTALSIDRFIAVVFPHTYRQKAKPKTVVLVNLCIVIFSFIFASIQLSDISFDVYLKIDLHLHTTFPLCTTSMAYLRIFFFLKKQSRIVRRKQTNHGNGLFAERQAARKEKKNGKEVCYDFISHFTVSNSFAHSIFYDDHCRNLLRKLLWSTLVFSFEGIVYRISALQLRL